MGLADQNSAKYRAGRRRHRTHVFPNRCQSIVLSCAGSLRSRTHSHGCPTSPKGKHNTSNHISILTDQDPREYLPFLRKLQQLPELRKHFEIDNYLGRLGKALKHLHALNAYDELQAYAIKHSLYKEALDAYKYQPEQLRDMTNIYADYLYDQSKHKEAAIGKSTQPNPDNMSSNPDAQHTNRCRFSRTPINATKQHIAGASHYTAH